MVTIHKQAAHQISGWRLERAVKFLENVQEHKEAVPMRRYAGGTGRCAQGTLTTKMEWETEAPEYETDGFTQASNSVYPVLDGPSSPPNFSSVSSRMQKQMPIPRVWILEI